MNAPVDPRMVIADASNWKPWMLQVTIWIASFLFTGTVALAQSPEDSSAPGGSDRTAVAANQAVADFMKGFAPRGVMADGSPPSPPEMALQRFALPDGLRIELVASEPVVRQPLFLSWDSRGRLWVVQYRQYQFPAGLKVVKVDQHLRAVFDRVPEPPPTGPPGADVITVLTDTNGDGQYDQQQDVIQGLNIATAVQHGHGGIWVLNPPYLLFYPDADGDGDPDSDPEVCLSGFGLQDTHSVANSMLWGPDGWLYGANGSTTTGSVSSAVSRGITFEGQCIWRYHPDSKIFEIYAEGGGNTFSLEIDAVGRVFSGTNGGGTRGFYYPQGSYASKNWGKHGPLTNPFAFGFFQQMRSEGDDRRFPQAFCIYEGGLLPAEYRGTVVAPNSLHNLVWNSSLLPDGSTFRTIDQPNLVETDDRWFRPVYGGVGPDGAIYLADWYDSRLSHVSPLDDWHKDSGRIYRIVPDAGQTHAGPGDLTQLPSAELVKLLAGHPNKWVRHRAVLELSWRGDRQVLPDLLDLVDRQQCLEALWAVNGLGELTATRGSEWLGSPNPHIRRWVVRLFGDRHEGPESLVELARHEPNVHVRSQLAGSAKRFEADLGLPILAALIARDEDSQDPHLPLMIWWGLEQHVESWPAVERMLSDPAIWRTSMMQQHLASRLIQRLATAGGPLNLQHCVRLMELAGGQEAARNSLMVGLLQAFEGRSLPALPKQLQSALDRYQVSTGMSELVLGVRQAESASIEEAVRRLADESESLPLRLQLAAVLGSQRVEPAQGLLLRLACSHREPALQRVALNAIGNYDSQSIGPALVARLDSSISAEHGLRDVAFRTLAARPAWAEALLNEVIRWRVDPQKIPRDVIQQLRSYEDQHLKSLVDQALGPPIQLSSEEKILQLQRLRTVIQSRVGDADAGREIYVQRCGNCHRLFGEGNNIGPALDGYERGNADFWLLNLVEPSAEIREGYQSYSALTVDGSLKVGMIEHRDGSHVVLRDADNQRIRLPIEDIEQLKPLATSLMPDDLLKDLSDQQVVDLLAYLSFGTSQRPADR
jgi:putative heme-binding domain-containing protein